MKLYSRRMHLNNIRKELKSRNFKKNVQNQKIKMKIGFMQNAEIQKCRNKI